MFYKNKIKKCIANARLIIQNLLKYGIIIDWTLLFVEEWYRWPAVLITIGLNFFIFISFYLEIAAVRRRFDDETIISLQIVNIMFLIFYPIISIMIFKPLMGKK